MLKPIPEFPDYFASDDGNVWSMKPMQRMARRPDLPHVLKPFLAGGYRMVILIREGRRIHKKVAVCVLEAFIGPRPPGTESCHGPAGKLVDSLHNLSWKSRIENNTVDKERDGTIMRGEKSGSSILTKESVKEIRRLRGSVSQRKLAIRFGIAHSTVSAIHSRRIWKEVE